MSAKTPTPNSSDPPLEEILYWQKVHGLDADEMVTKVTIFQHFQTHQFFYPRATAEKLWNMWLERNDDDSKSPMHLNFVFWHGNLTLDITSIVAFQIMDAYPYEEETNEDEEEDGANSFD